MSDTTEEPPDFSPLAIAGVTLVLVVGVVLLVPVGLVVAGARYIHERLAPTEAEILAKAYAISVREAEEVLHAVGDDPRAAGRVITLATWTNKPWRELVRTDGAP